MKRVFTVFLCLGATGALLAQGDYQRGLSYYKQNQYQRAIAEFEAIVKEQPDYEFGQRILGFSYLKVKRYDKSIAALRAAIRLKNDYFESYLALALAYFNSGRYREVLSTLQRAESYARSPRDKYRLYRTRGAAAFNLKDFTAAASDLEQAVTIQRGNPKDTLQLGIAYYHLKQDDKALRYLRQAQALDPEGGEANRFLSRLNYRQAVEDIESGNYRKAAETLRSYLDQNPGDGEAWFNLGLAYLFAENLKASEEALRRSARMAPEIGDTYDRLGFIYEKTKRYRKALDAYQKAYKLTQSDDAKANLERIKRRIRRTRQSG
ncbi:MAG: tetratricopeptide repeat protein [Acidobacteriota bacterium]